MLNKVMLIGYLGKDPEVRYTGTGTAVCNFTLATRERWQDPSGQRKEATEWHKVTAWGKLAEICGQYLHKGSKVYIEGKLQTRKWQDQNGQDRSTTEISAREMTMLEGKPQQQSSVYQDNNDAQLDKALRRPPEQQAWVRKYPNRHNPPGYEDEVPF